MLTVLGRVDDAISTGGLTVLPQLVEAALATHPAVADCAVFGVADERLGQRVVAAVVVASGAGTADAGRAASHVAQTLDATAAPREVHVVDELPRRGIGKVDRSALAPFALRRRASHVPRIRAACMMRHASRSETVDELRAIVGHPNKYVANKVGRPAVPRPAGLACALAARLRRDDRCAGTGRRLAEGRSARLRPRHRRHHDRDPGAARQQARRRLPQRAGAATRRHAVPHPRPRRHAADQRIRPDTRRRRILRRDGRCQGKRPILALEIDVEEVFFHCAKAFLRSDAWDPSTWNPTAVPSVAQIAKAIRAYDWSQDQLDEYYSEDNLRKILY